MSTMSSNLMDDSYSSHEKQRNWLELPCDVTLMILMKLRHMDVLEYVQFVCKLWYKLCKDPSMWRTIHIGGIDKPASKLEKMALNAVHRSAGDLIDLDVEGFGSDELLSYVASRSSQLKRLRFACPAIVCVNATAEALGRLSSLEELELTLSFFHDENAVPIINSCPLITTFKFNNVYTTNPLRVSNSDVEALAIARSMPELRHLQLIGNYMTNAGLTAILDGCPHLQSLDLRACFCLRLDHDGYLFKRLSDQINELRYPDDSTEDYKCHTTDAIVNVCFYNFQNRPPVDDEYSSDDSYYEFSDDELDESRFYSDYSD